LTDLEWRSIIGCILIFTFCFMLDFDFKQCTPMHPIYSKEECKNARQVNKNLSYIWVSNKEGDAEVPCTEITHGIQNIIRSA
jgi:hypothetical protein